MPLLDVRGLTVDLRVRGELVRVLDDVSFSIQAGEALGLMGPSGAGKTLTALSIMGLLPDTARIASGAVLLQGRNLLDASPREWQDVRGARIGMVFQDPMTALHPTMPVVEQVAEALLAHQPALDSGGARAGASALLERTGVQASPRSRGTRAFEWSGGMRQRAVIAMAMANRPALLIADEPTTALDVSTQAQVLALLAELQHQTGTALLFITHDASIVAMMADRVASIRDGRITRIETVHAFAAAAATDAAAEREVDTGGASVHAATDRAANATGTPESSRVRLADRTATAGEVLRVDNLSVQYDVRGRALSWRRQRTTAVDRISVALHAGEIFGIVGESGCGKSTFARSLVGLERAATGSIVVDGIDITRASARELRSARARIQIVFQDPYSSLNPRRRIGESVVQPLRIHGRPVEPGGRHRAGELLERVGLPAAYATRFPHELSGGERQRVAIARALALDPRVLVLDEPVSSLDPAAREGVLGLLRELRAASNLACILIAHDLRVVRDIADRIAVMYLGRFVEVGPTVDLFARALHPYTQMLLSAIPPADPALRGEWRALRTLGEPPDAARPPAGCRFHPRCWKADSPCRSIEPVLEPAASAGHTCACHFAAVLEAGPGMDRHNRESQ